MNFIVHMFGIVILSYLRDSYNSGDNMNNTELGIGDNTVLCTNPARAALLAAVPLSSLDCVASPHHYPCHAPVA
jgi:hypothetical protein